MSPMLGSNVSRAQAQPAPVQNNSQTYQQDHMRPPIPPQDAAIDPALSGEGVERRMERQPDGTQDLGYIEAVKAWSRFRFVRARWFTPQEAIEYIE